MGKRFGPPRPANPKGFAEDLAFVELNNAILKAAGGSWHRPPPESAILDQETTFETRIKRLIHNSSKRSRLWGWKDPRTTLTIRLYLPHLVNPHFICCVRTPDQVAASLAKREDWPLPRCQALCRTYNNRMLRFMQYFTGANIDG